MRYFKRTIWGFEHRTKYGQYGASVGLTPAQYLGRDLTKVEARLWRKHGVMVAP